MLDKSKIEELSKKYKGVDYSELYSFLGIKYDPEHKNLCAVACPEESPCKTYVDGESFYFSLATVVLTNFIADFNTRYDSIGHESLYELRAFLLALSKNCATYWQDIWKAGWQIENDHVFLQFLSDNFGRMWW